MIFVQYEYFTKLMKSIIKVRYKKNGNLMIESFVVIIKTLKKNIKKIVAIAISSITYEGES